MEDLLNYNKEMIYKTLFIPKSMLENNNRLNLDRDRLNLEIEKLCNDNNIKIK